MREDCMRRLLFIASMASFLVSQAVADDDIRFDFKVCEGSIKWDAKIAACSRLIENPKVDTEGRANALFNRGHGWDQKRDYDRAIADYTASIALDPNDEHAYLYRGNAWASKRQADRAIADYSEAIRLNPEFAEAYYSRSKLWRRKGNYVRAKDDLDKAIKLDPKILSSEK
jgi:tetratricopeptide (TPR) repeat protein